MQKTVTMWAVFTPKDDILDWTIRTQAYVSEVDFLESAFAPFGGYIHSIDWPKYEKKGYTCRQVRITIEEIKNER